MADKFEDIPEGELLSLFQKGEVSTVDYVCLLSSEVCRDYVSWLRCSGLPMNDDTAWEYLDFLDNELQSAAGS